MRIQSFFKMLPIASAVVLSSALTVAVGQSALAVDAPKPQADTAKPQANAESCRSAVQGFYDWYKTANPPGNGDKVEYATKKKASMFTPELTKMLAADFAASAKSPGEIVGLDFDPFLNAQDEPERMVAKNATMKGSNCLVEVFVASKSGKLENSKKAQVTPELALKNGNWVFVNFHYPASDMPKDNDLISVLKGLAAHRIKYPVTPVKPGKPGKSGK